MNNKYITQKIIFPSETEKDWRGSLASKLKNYQKGFVEVDSGEWSLKCKDLKDLDNLCKSMSLKMTYLESTIPETIVSAKALGIRSNLKLKTNKKNQLDFERNYIESHQESNLFFHHGTLRSGERLETDGNLLILGDVNPGAMVLAGGSVIIWGRLLGIAHAGKDGNTKAKISALQLRPVQLRIANKIARGPKEPPDIGFAEEAIIEKGIIIINPAKTK